MKRIVAIASACAAAAVAAWLVPASVQIVAWPPAGPERVAYFAPLIWLWGSLGVAVLASLGLAALSVDASLVAPLQWLWAWTVPFWPVLPDRLPLLLIFAGPARWVVVAAAGIVVARRVARSRGWSCSPPRLGRRWAFALSLAVYLVAGLAWHRELGLGGDEPHYLVIAQSLLADHDLNIENNHARRDYAMFYQGPLRPDYLVRGRHGEIYSIHAPGLPALVLPAYAVAGATGVIVFLMILAALAALAVFDVAIAIGGACAGWMTWAAVCLTVPFVPHAWMVYPEIVAALIAAWAVRWLVARDDPGSWWWMCRGAALAALPWLHTKYTILLAALTVSIGISLYRRLRWTALRPAAALLAPIVISLAAWFLTFRVMYGAFDPQAPYGSYPGMFVKSSNILRGILGLLIDQKFGILVYAPIYAMTIAGCWMLWRAREERLVLIAAVVTIAAFVASTSRLYMWWGGSSAPARFLVPVLPLAAVLLPRPLVSWPRTSGTLLAVSLLFSTAALSNPSRLLLLSAPHGESQLLAWLQDNAPLTSVWPTFTEPDLGDQFPRLGRGLVGRFDAGARARTVAHGREDLLEGYDTRRRAFDYLLRSRADEAFVVSRGLQRRSRRDGELNDDPGRLAGPFRLAAGDYAVRVWFAGDPAPAFARYHRGPSLTTFAVGQPGQPTGGELHLPVDASVIWIAVADEATAARVEAVEVRPMRVVPLGKRLAIDPRAIDPLRPDGLLLYADGNSYPEGGVFWTRGTAAATVYVDAGHATTLTVILHLGPNAGTVRLTVGDSVREIRVAAGSTTDVAMPIDPGASLLRITVESSASFVPSQADPHSDDSRRLGCQARILLS